MMRKFTIYNLQFTIALVCTLYIIHYTFFTPPTLAQSCTSSSSRATGLISTPQRSATSKFGTSSGACVIDPKAAFAPYKVPTFDDLKSIYYDQAKTASGVTKHDPLINGDKTQADIPMTTGNDHIYYVKKTNPTAPDGNLTINSNIPGNQTGVVFVDNNLNINSPIIGTDNSGLVFVVKGNVNILQSVNRVDAIIISEGSICTAFDGIVCPGTNVPTSQHLVINGSLISLNEAAPIKFRRALTDNTQAAERINHQVKYLVILRNLVSDTFQRWSEVTGDEPIPTPAPVPSPAPTPTPTPPPALAYKRVFVTSTTYNGNLGRLAGADAKCQTRADAASLGSTWKAWIAEDTSASSPSVRFTHFTQPYKLLDGTTLANNWTDLTTRSPSIFNINVTEFGSTVSTQDDIWSSVSPSGAPQCDVDQNACGRKCLEWSDTVGYYGNTGKLNTNVAGGWTKYSFLACQTSLRLYCFEQ